MRFLSYLKPQQYPFYVPEVFQKHFAVNAATLIQDPFQSQSSPLKLGEKSVVTYSLHEPLPASFVLNACHSNKIVPASSIPLEADAHFIVTTGNSIYPDLGKQPQTLAIRTADCLPIALAYENKNVFIGALVHAGWRGYTSGILKNSLLQLLQEATALNISAAEFIKNLKVHIGPAIFGHSYECGLDVKSALNQHKQDLIMTYQQLHSGDAEQIPLFYLDLYDNLMDVRPQPVSQSIYPDLQLLAALEFVIFGLLEENVEILRENTYSHPVLFSYREATHKKAKARCYQWTHLTCP